MTIPPTGCEDYSDYEHDSMVAANRELARGNAERFAECTMTEDDLEYRDSRNGAPWLGCLCVVGTLIEIVALIAVVTLVAMRLGEM